jgi:hypothetical protein
VAASKKEATMQGPGKNEIERDASNEIHGFGPTMAQIPMVIFTAWWNMWMNLLVPPIHVHSTFDEELSHG